MQQAQVIDGRVFRLKRVFATWVPNDHACRTASSANRLLANLSSLVYPVALGTRYTVSASFARGRIQRQEQLPGSSATTPHTTVAALQPSTFVCKIPLLFHSMIMRPAPGHREPPQIRLHRGAFLTSESSGVWMFSLNPAHARPMLCSRGKL